MPKPRTPSANKQPQTAAASDVWAVIESFADTPCFVQRSLYSRYAPPHPTTHRLVRCHLLTRRKQAKGVASRGMHSAQRTTTAACGEGGEPAAAAGAPASTTTTTSRYAPAPLPFPLTFPHPSLSHPAMRRAPTDAMSNQCPSCKMQNTGLQLGPFIPLPLPAAAAAPPQPPLRPPCSSWPCRSCLPRLGVDRPAS